MKRLIALLLISISVLFVSCEYGLCYNYTIVNKTSSNIVIRTETNSQHYNNIYFADSIYIVKAGEKQIFMQDLGLGGKIVPGDSYAPEDTIPQVTKFDIYVGNTLQNKLRLRKYWDYNAVTGVGTYELNITDSLLEKL